MEIEKGAGPPSTLGYVDGILGIEIKCTQYVSITNTEEVIAMLMIS